MTKQLAIGLAVIGVFLTVAVAGGAFAVYGYKAAKEAEANTAKMLYNMDVSATVKVMAEKMAYLEYVDIMQDAVWYNAIHEKKDAETDAFTAKITVKNTPFGPMKDYEFFDFNTALRNLYRDETFSTRHKEAEASVNVFQNEVAKLHDYPAGCEQMHDAFVDLYAAYVAYADVVLDTGGSSYMTYTADANAARKELTKQFSLMETYITTTEE